MIRTLPWMGVAVAALLAPLTTPLQASPIGFKCSDVATTPVVSGAYVSATATQLCVNTPDPGPFPLALTLYRNGAVVAQAFGQSYEGQSIRITASYACPHGSTTAQYFATANYYRTPTVTLQCNGTSPLRSRGSR